jgi:hypothetical protein
MPPQPTIAIYRAATVKCTAFEWIDPSGKSIEKYALQREIVKPLAYQYLDPPINRFSENEQRKSGPGTAVSPNRKRHRQKGFLSRSFCVKTPAHHGRIFLPG